MNSLLPVILPIAAIGYSLLYLLCGGGFVGAAVIFVIAKFFGK
jgi:ABC-type molybdate transport system permease subunit